MIATKELSKLFICLILALLGIRAWLSPALAQEGGQLEPGGAIYTVQPGDTLFAIAVHYNLSPAQIALANHLSNFDLIFPGQQLTLPIVLVTLPAQPLSG